MCVSRMNILKWNFCAFSLKCDSFEVDIESPIYKLGFSKVLKEKLDSVYKDPS